MRGKIIYHEYDELNGKTKLEKATKYGSFVGEVKVHPEDKDIANVWDGANFAEMKCNIAAIREKAKWMRQRAIGAENALRALDNISSSNDGLLDPYTLDMLDSQVKAAHREADRCREIYEEMRDSYKAYTQYTLKRRKYLREKVDKRNED